MASLLFTIGAAVVNALAFSGTNFVFSRLTDHGEEDCKRQDLALESFKGLEMNGIRIEWNGLILSIKEASPYISNVDEPMLEYYRPFIELKTNKAFATWAPIISFLPSIRDQNSGEIFFVAVGTDIAIYALNKSQKKRNYIKYIINLIAFGLVTMQ